MNLHEQYEAKTEEMEFAKKELKSALAFARECRMNPQTDATVQFAYKRYYEKRAECQDLLGQIRGGN